MNQILSLLTFVSTLNSAINPAALVVPKTFDLPDVFEEATIKSLAAEEIWVRDEDVGPILRDNIILQLHYIKGDAWAFRKNDDRAGMNPAPTKGEIMSPDDIDWERLEEPFEGYFVLEQGEVFAFHPEVLPEFDGDNLKAVPARFGYEDGFKTYGGLPGNGVCYLASLINWVAKEAGLETIAKVNHDFYPVPGVPREYGVAIYYLDGSETAKVQNLYIKNTLNRTALFYFSFDGEKVRLGVY